MNASVTRIVRKLVRVLTGVFFALFAVLSSATPVARADDGQEARLLFEAGVVATRAERWEDARDYFKRSIALVPKVSSLLNLAVAEVQLELFEDALKTLEAFDALAREEHGALIERAQSLRALAEQRARERREAAAAATPASTPEPAQDTDSTVTTTFPVQPSEHGRASENGTPWKRLAARSTLVAAGVFGGVAVGGGIGWWVMNGKLDECDSGSPPCLNRDDVLRDRDRATRIAYATGAVALSLAITATVWLLRERRNPALQATDGGLRFHF